MDKGIIACGAVTAMAGTITFAILWAGWLETFEQGQIQCNWNPQASIDVVGRWKTAVELNMWTYIVMSISCILAVVGAFVAAVRLVNGIIQVCCIGTLQMVAIIYLGVVRLDANGAACADDRGNDMTQQFGAFALNMFIAELVLSCCLSSCMSISVRYRKGREMQ